MFHVKHFFETKKPRVAQPEIRLWEIAETVYNGDGKTERGKYFHGLCKNKAER